MLQMLMIFPCPFSIIPGITALLTKMCIRDRVDEDVEEDEPRGYAVQKTVNAVLAVLSVVLFFLTQPLVWRFRLVDWWTVLFMLLCGTAVAMLIWRRKSEAGAEEDTAEE